MRRSWSASWVFAAMVVIAAGYQAALFAWPRHAFLVSNVGFLLAQLASVVNLARVAWRNPGFPRRVWGTAFVAMANWLIAQVIYGVEEVDTGALAGHPSPADIPNLLCFVFAVTAMLMQPTAPASWAGRLRMIFDGLI